MQAIEDTGRRRQSTMQESRDVQYPPVVVGFRSTSRDNVAHTYSKASHLDIHGRPTTLPAEREPATPSNTHVRSIRKSPPDVKRLSAIHSRSPPLLVAAAVPRHCVLFIFVYSYHYRRYPSPTSSSPACSRAAPNPRGDQRAFDPLEARPEPTPGSCKVCQYQVAYRPIRLVTLGGCRINWPI
jgi:hypothetical protein